MLEQCNILLPDTFTLHIPSFVTAEFLLFIKSKLKMFYTRINAPMDTSDRGLTHPFQGLESVANSFTGIQNTLIKCFFIFSCS